jgi:hypothetical protein
MEGNRSVGAASVLNNETAVTRVSAADLGYGADPIKAVYGGDGWYAPATSGGFVEKVVVPSQVSITSVTPQPGVFGQEVDVSATVGGQALSQPRSGLVTLHDGRRSIATEQLPSTGQVTFAVTNLPAGLGALTVSYGGALPYEPATSSPVLQEVWAQPTETLHSSANPQAPGSPVTLVARLSATPSPGVYTGIVTFYLNGSTVLGTADVDSLGRATLTTSFNAIGSYYILAEYGGNALYLGTGTTLVENVSGTTHVSLVTSDQTDRTGADVGLTATVTGTPTSLGTPTGSVEFVENGQILTIAALDSTGTAIATVAAESFQPGTATITAEYFGDSSFAGSTSSSIRQTVTLPTKINIVSSTNQVEPGSSVTFTALVYGYPGAWPSLEPAGSVTFHAGTTNLGTATLDVNGSASLTVDASDPVGAERQDTASYANNGAYDFSTSRRSFVQVIRPTTVALSSAENPANLGDLVVVAAQVSPTSSGGPPPTGFVTFMDGPVILSQEPVDGLGVASLPLATAIYGAGTLAITAVFGGDPSYATSTSPALDEVVVASLTPTTTQLSGTPNPATPGASVTFTATVLANPPAPGTPTGTLTFFSGPTAVATVALDSNASASCSTSSLPTGDNTLSAVYGGDSSYAGSTGIAFETIGNATQTVTTSSAQSVPAGTSVTFSATVTSSSGAPAGMVIFLVGKTQVGHAALTAGVASLDLVVNSTEAIVAIYEPSPGSSYLVSESSPFTATVI